MWVAAAVLSAFFAGVTSILSKCGLKSADSDVATAVRTSVVLIFAWLIVLITGAYFSLSSVCARSWIFLILSGVSTGASWICYFKALSVGEVSKVSAVDKSSIVTSVLFAMIIFPDERERWWLKLIFLAVITCGVYLMTDIRHGDSKSKYAWFIFAAMSSVFAAATSLLAKAGIENVDSNAATAIRTCVVFVMAWLIVICRGKSKLVNKLGKKEIVFLVLSGIATGVSWLCYYYAVQQGQVSIVAPIDRLSVTVTVLFSVVVLKEKLSLSAWTGLLLLTAGTVCMVIFS